jgi:hypothetical protein
MVHLQPNWRNRWCLSVSVMGRIRFGKFGILTLVHWDDERGHYELGNLVLPESSLPLVWRPVAAEPAGQEWLQSRLQTGRCRACGQSVVLRYVTAYFELEGNEDVRRPGYMLG